MKRQHLLTILFLFSTTSSLALATAFDHEHKDFSKLLTAHIQMSKDKTSSSVDYKNFNKPALNKYLKTVSAVTKKEFSTFSKGQKLSFYINAYNAYTIKLILNNYPVSSIKKIGYFFSSPWKKTFFKLFGKETSLDQIEHSYVRADKKGLGSDARIHFAFNCASIGCPALLNEAWTAEKLPSQLDDAAKGFLKDHSRNRVNLKNKSVEISNIFKWYGDDFTDRNYKSLKDFLSLYVDSIASSDEEKTLVKSGEFSIDYSGYNWSLNKSK